MTNEERPLLDPSTTVPGIVATEIETNYNTIETPQDNTHLEESPLSPNRQLIILCSLYIHIFLGALDTTIVATLLTTIGTDIDALPQVNWIASSYLLSCSAFQPLFGKLSDIFGRRVLLLICNACFAGGCLVCGLTSEFKYLVLGRFVTGIGGGGFNTLGTITMSDIIPLRKRGVYQGYGNIAFGVGAASGGVIAGVFPNWRWAFLSQVPICLIAGVMILSFLHLPKGSPGLGVHGHDIIAKFKKIDLIGSSILVGSLMVFMIALSLGFDGNLPWILLIGSGIGSIVFYQWELRFTEDPVIPVKLLRQPTVIASSFSCFFMSMASFTILYFGPFFWTTVKDLSASESGARLVSNFIGVSTGSVFAGHYMKNTGKYYSLALVSGGLTVFGYLEFWFMSRKSSTLQEMTVMFLPGFGMAVMITVSLVAMISAVDHKDQALTTSIQYGFRSVGSTLGVTMASAIFEKGLQSSLVKNFVNLKIPDDYTPEMIRQIMDRALHESNYGYHGAPDFAQEAIISSYNVGCHRAILFGLITCVLSVVSNLFIEEHKLTRK